MKLTKKTTLLVSFTVGALLMATTALADIANKSGYDQLKDSLKITAENCTEKFDSYTLDLSFAIKDNGKVLSLDNEVKKYDLRTNANESVSHQERLNEDPSTRYYYTDKTTDIRLSSEESTYYVTEFAEERELYKSTNPFKEKEAADVERIADALIGSLKEQVVVKENADGSKQLTGSLSEVQIPSLFNAFVSLQMKQEFNGRQNNMPHLTEDIFIKSVTGSALINKEGTIENILGTATLSGKDSEGVVHELSVEILVEISDINATTVSKPDLTGKKVVKQEGKQPMSSEPGISNPQKFIGKFKNDILIEKDGRFIKIGERYVDITHFDNSTVTGKYYEVYKEGYENEAANSRTFTFEGKFDKEPRQSEIHYVTESGAKASGHIYMDEFSAKVNLYVNIPYSELGYDATFSPVLD